MRSTSAAATITPSLLSSSTSFTSGRTFKFPVKTSIPVKFRWRKPTTTSAASSPSNGIASCKSNSNAFRRRALMYMATASFLLSQSTSYAVAADEGSLLHEEIRKVLSKAKAAGLLRLVFHDAGTFDKDDKTGGMNGSVVYELERPENAGLKKSLKILEKAKIQVDAVEPVSWADMIAVAGAEAILVCGGPKIPVQLGRLDANRYIFLHRMADPDGKLPEESLDVIALKQCFDRKGFTTKELVALSGAHTLGSKGFGNPVVFDNSYYKILLEKPWLSSDGMSSMIGLPSDRALVEDDDCMRWISKYANDQSLFFEDFKNVYIKLVNTGAKWRRSA
ncbi:putative L-ascorbate peroxidase 6 isoform X2 [Olea europaea var. sylvestris]|uniref:putative L-ascorbate peroxidase 6 isoform X2 n=1 Tax=Olea europaea var. sylvestris TaxID=158386 RepID=UPI000C1D298F|nr:putative L-ascorbate peroxidase 6 isoform X2 [Olea europaea var. sylvestris]